jgi:hypothetical protein
VPLSDLAEQVHDGLVERPIRRSSSSVQVLLMSFSFSVSSREGTVPSSRALAVIVSRSVRCYGVTRTFRALRVSMDV